MNDEAIRIIDNHVDAVMNDMKKCQEPIQNLKTVYNNLGSWANDAAIGQNVKDCINKINNGMDALFEITGTLMDSIKTYNDKQKSINSTGNNIEILR